MSDTQNLDSDILTIEEIAGYLKVSPKTIHRMIKAREIPAARIGGQWRFLKDSIVSWLSERTMAASTDDLCGIISTAETIIPITRLVGPELVVMDIPGGSRKGVLTPMVRALVDAGIDIDVETYVGLLLSRESMVSTAVKAGVAFPHLRAPGAIPVERPSVVLGICPGGTDFNALDGGPTYVLVMCCSCTEVVHLRLMAKMAMLFRADDMVNNIRAAETKQDVLSLLVKTDSDIAMSM